MNDEFLRRFSLEDKIAIVTGGNKGLGKAISLGLASAGAHVVIAARDVSSAEEVSAMIEKRGRKTLVVQTDVRNEDEVIRLVDESNRKFGYVDILVNNAGVINRPRQAATDITEEEWDRIININLKGTFLVSREVAKGMILRKKGKILCIGSMLCEIVQVMHAPYVASKGGIRQLVKALALEWAPYNIHVNALCPHYFRTDFVKETLDNEEHLNQLMDKIPMKRIGEPEDIVGAAIFLTSGASDLITGQILLIDAGYSLP
jgi:NAD(P)-dependent dehydrogenase (short-subunit alcohol dehydrogenase family)